MMITMITAIASEMRATATDATKSANNYDMPHDAIAFGAGARGTSQQCSRSYNVDVKCHMMQMHSSRLL